MGIYAAQYRTVITGVHIATVKAASVLAEQNERGVSFYSRHPMNVLAHKATLRITICVAERLNHDRVRKRTQ
jgi:hypothetical protein